MKWGCAAVLWCPWYCYWQCPKAGLPFSELCWPIWQHCLQWSLRSHELSKMGMEMLSSGLGKGFSKLLLACSHSRLSLYYASLPLNFSSRVLHATCGWNLKVSVKCEVAPLSGGSGKIGLDCKAQSCCGLWQCLGWGNDVTCHCALCISTIPHVLLCHGPRVQNCSILEQNRDRCRRMINLTPTFSSSPSLEHLPLWRQPWQMQHHAS